jgi:hypothetical protein
MFSGYRFHLNSRYAVRFISQLLISACVCTAQDAEQPCPGRVETNLGGRDIKLNLEEPTPFHITVRSSAGELWKGKLVLRMKPDGVLRFEPQKIEIADGEADAAVTVRGTNLGLGRVRGDVDGWPSKCAGIDTPVDLGFRQRVRLVSSLSRGNTSGAAKDLKAGDTPEMFWIQFVDAQNNPIAIASGLTVNLRTSLGRFGLRKDSSQLQDWDASLPVAANEGRSASEPVYLKLEKTDSGPGVMDVNISISGKTVHDAKIDFKSDLSAMPLFLWILGGSLVWTLISFVLDRVKKRTFSSGEIAWSLVATIAISVLAYFLDGSKLTAGLIDRSTSAGAFQYGIIVAAIGLDGIVKKLVPQGGGQPA